MAENDLSKTIEMRDYFNIDIAFYPSIFIDMLSLFNTTMHHFIFVLVYIRFLWHVKMHDTTFGLCNRVARRMHLNAFHITKCHIECQFNSIFMNQMLISDKDLFTFLLLLASVEYTMFG